jgi:TolB-like protein/Tfp pilus assembly protein PilF
MGQLAENNKPRSGFSKKRLIYIISIVIGFVICYLVVGYLFVNKSISDNVLSAKSIAVLPFKDFSPDDNNQWFSDGVSDNILHSLAQMNDLRVISFTSSSTYRDTDKQIPQIAKELKVSYILEGSITLYEGKIKIIAQLIDSNDEHLWSKEYNESFDDIITVQNNVAQEVMKQLEMTLNPQEEIILKKYPTDNMEAYNLHLKGRLVNNSRRTTDIRSNIEYNKKAIALDSNFADAYAEVGRSYFLLSFKNYNKHSDEHINEAVNYIDHALKIDPNCYRALPTKSFLIQHLNSDQAIEYLEKAITLNPNDAESHYFYALFLRLFRQDYSNYILHSALAHRLDPFSTTLGRNYFYSLVLSNQIMEAEGFLKKMDFLYSEKEILVFHTWIIAYKNKDWTQVIPFLEAKIEKDPNNDILYRCLANVYDQVMNDDNTGVTYAKRAYEIDSSNYNNVGQYLTVLEETKNFEEVIRIIQSANYKSIRSKGARKKRLWRYYYHQENYIKALEVSTDSMLTGWYSIQARTYAQLGDRKKLDSLNKIKSPSLSRYYNALRAHVFAILKERDSMYYYLEKAKFDLTIGFANGFSEFDLYRNEERFKAILRDNYLPVPGE